MSRWRTIRYRDGGGHNLVSGGSQQLHGRGCQEGGIVEQTVVNSQLSLVPGARGARVDQLDRGSKNRNFQTLIVTTDRSSRSGDESSIVWLVIGLNKLLKCDWIKETVNCDSTAVSNSQLGFGTGSSQPMNYRAPYNILNIELSSNLISS